MARSDNKSNEGSGRFEELIGYFEKGKEFTEELMKENSRLRIRLMQQAKEILELKSVVDTEYVYHLLEENKGLKEKIELMEGWLEEIEQENKDFANRYLEIQAQNDSLLNLYVASYQLHSTMDPDEVEAAIVEIILNLIGAEEYFICMFDQDRNSPTIVVGEGPEGTIRRKKINQLDPVLQKVFSDGMSYFRQRDEVGIEHLACVPMKIKDEVVGALSISKLLDHKKESLSAIDHELLSLLADNAATALVGSNLFSRTRRRLKTVESFVGLLKIDEAGQDKAVEEGKASTTG